jgi:hypothetical protein
MTLPYDYARCDGRIVQQKIPGPQTAITISHGQAQCVQCLRRTAERGEHVLMMEPPQFVDGKCPMRADANSRTTNTVVDNKTDFVSDK